jgi:hypothetical protein
MCSLPQSVGDIVFLLFYYYPSLWEILFSSCSTIAPVCGRYCFCPVQLLPQSVGDIVFVLSSLIASLNVSSCSCNTLNSSLVFLYKNIDHIISDHWTYMYGNAKYTNTRNQQFCLNYFHLLAQKPNLE